MPSQTFLKIPIVLALVTLVGFGCANFALAQSAVDTNALILSLQKQILQLLTQIQALQKEVTELKTETGLQTTAMVTEEISEPDEIIELPEFTRSLSLGARGDDVRKLQEFLARDKDIYPEGLTTGFYGPRTVEAVRRWQRKNNVEAVGTVGPKTIARFRELGQVPRLGSGQGVVRGLIEQGAPSGMVPPGLLTAPGIQKQIATSTSSGQATTSPMVIPPMMATATPPVSTPATTTPAVPAIPAEPATPAVPGVTSAVPATPATPAQPTTVSGTTSLDWTKLTNGCNPKAVWNGSEYGVVWGKICNSGENEIYFSRFTGSGIKIGGDLLISTGHFTADSNYVMAWAGVEYAILWEDYWGNVPLHSNTYSSYNTYFSRVSSQGQKSGADVKIGTGGQYQDMHLFWNNSEYVLIYINYRPNEIRFRKLSSDGQNLGSTKIISSPNKSIDRLSVTWTGTEYSLTWNYFQAYGGGSESVRLSANGDLISQTAPGDTTPPSTPTNLTAVAYISTQVNLSWATSTDNTAVAGYKIYRNNSYIASTASTDYSDQNLTPATTYTYTVAAYDAAGNVSIQSSQTSVTTLATTAPAPSPSPTGADTTAPVISTPAGTYSYTTNITSNSATINWTTNEPADSQLDWGTWTSGFIYQTPRDTSLVTNHSVALTGLYRSSVYSYRINSKDAAGNLATQYDNFRTMPEISNVQVSNITDHSTLITWDTSEGLNADTVFYGLDTNYGLTQSRTISSWIQHSIDLSGLTAGTTYHFYLKSQNTNVPTYVATSGDYIFTTLSSTTSTTATTTTATTTTTSTILDSLDGLLKQLQELLR